MNHKHRVQRNKRIAFVVTIALFVVTLFMMASMFNDARAAGLSCNATDVLIPKVTYIGECYITGYDTCLSCCGKTDGITASGVPVTVGRTIAAFGVPFGTKLYIVGLGLFVVEDRGVRIGVIDVACNNHAECYAITGMRGVYVIGGA